MKQHVFVADDPMDGYFDTPFIMPSIGDGTLQYYLIHKMRLYKLCIFSRPTLSTCGGKATHGLIFLPVIKEFGVACIFDVFLLSGTSKMNLFPEKTVCFGFST